MAQHPLLLLKIIAALSVMTMIYIGNASFLQTQQTQGYLFINHSFAHTALKGDYEGTIEIN